MKCCLLCESVDDVAARRINERIHELVTEKKLFNGQAPAERAQGATIADDLVASVRKQVTAAVSPRVHVEQVR